MSKTLTYSADGLNFQSQLFHAASATAPAVLVFPEAFGLSEHALGKAERLASLGYHALACDLHGDAKLVTDLQEAIGLLQPLFTAPERTRARATAALQALVSETGATRAAAIGYCFGGTMALELARSGANIQAAVGFHSGLGSADPVKGPGTIKAKILVCIGADDPMIPAEQRAAFEAEMRAARVDWQLHVYGGVVHSFTEPKAASRNMPDAIRYSAEADARSFASMESLFKEILAA